MTFASPQYLMLLATLPLAAAVVYWAMRRRSLALDRVGNADLVRRLTASANTGGRARKAALVIVALGLAIVALARPQWGATTQVVEREGVQLIVALDISKSMLAEDLKPNRLSRAKLEVHELMRQLGGDEVGLVLFAGSAFVQFPLTFDYATARTFLDNASPEMIQRQGTNLARAIYLSLTGLADERPGEKVILIITDGEDHEGEAMAAAEEAALMGVIIYTIGMGSTEGTPIPIKGYFGRDAGYVKDSQGDLVLSRLNEEILRDVAEAGGGVYIRAGGDRSAADQFAQELAGLQKTSVESEVETTRVERFQLFAGLSVILLIASELITDRRRTPLVSSHGRTPS